MEGGRRGEGEEFVTTFIAEQLLHNIRLSGDGRRLDGILPQLVLLGEGNRLLPPLVLAVDARGDLAEEDQLVLLQPRRQVNGLVVVVVLD
jgi:hypothetical protein